MIRKIFFLQLLVLCTFGFLFLSFQNKAIYKKTLGKVADNWQKINGERVLAYVPYIQADNNNMVQWDAKQYLLIKDHGYDAELAGSDFIYAFFPLFPAIWKISHLPPMGISILNYIFFSLSILLLLKLFSTSHSYKRDTILSLSLPGLIIFFIPYTEATYLLTVTVGIWGFMKRKYWIFFIGLFLASLTRPSFTFLMLSIVGVEFFFLAQHKNFLLFIKNSALRTLPLICGTALVSLVQFLQGSNSIFKFVEVQKYWQNFFSIPHNIKDWSHEGFGINLGIVLMVFIPLVIISSQLIWDQLKRLNAGRGHLDYNSNVDYLVLLSIIYIIGNTVFVLLFRGGSLNCLFRFTICSPFIFVLIYRGFDYVKSIQVNLRTFIFASLTLTSILMLGLIDYSTCWNYSDMGIFSLISTLFLWFFQDFSRTKGYQIAQYVVLFCNCIWSTYLFNMYINDGWIFA